jgi:hypothetical protein
MYIEFQLPNGSAGQAAAYARYHIQLDLKEWERIHGISYTEKTVKYTHRVCFNTPEEYSLFLISWDPKTNFAKNFKVIDIP